MNQNISKLSTRIIAILLSTLMFAYSGIILYAEKKSSLNENITLVIDTASDNDIISVWIWLKAFPREYIEKLVKAETGIDPETDSNYNYEQYQTERRKIISREYTAKNTAFIEEYIGENSSEKILYCSSYTSTIIAKLTKSEILKCATSDEVDEITLYEEVKFEDTENSTEDKELKLDYLVYLNSTKPNNSDIKKLTVGDIELKRNYGEYNGYRIVLLNYIRFASPLMLKLRIGEYVFEFPNQEDGENFLAYKNGNFIQVKELYDAGGLSKEDITTIYRKHKGAEFYDVPRDSWYFSAVDYVYKEGLFSGISKTHFAPGSTMTRAMFVAVLWRMAGSPEYSKDFKNPFSDIQSDKWYFNAVMWASENKIAAGIDNRHFSPDTTVNRMQLAVFIRAFSEKFDVYHTSVNKEESEIILVNYPDSNNISNWARQDMAWAIKNGLIVGSSQNGNIYLCPKDLTTRAQAAMIIYKFCIRFE